MQTDSYDIPGAQNMSEEGIHDLLQKGSVMSNKNSNGELQKIRIRNTKIQSKNNFLLKKKRKSRGNVPQKTDFCCRALAKK